jgi:hypothetical protein
MMAGARRASTIHSPVLEQGVMADLMASGAFSSGTCCGMRQNTAAATTRFSAAAAPARARPAHAGPDHGLHAVADGSAPAT